MLFSNENFTSFICSFISNSGMTKESTERVMKTVRQKLSSEKSDKGYLQLVKIYVDLPEPFNEILSKPPQDGDHTGVFQFLKKKTGEYFLNTLFHIFYFFD